MNFEKGIVRQEREVALKTFLGADETAVISGIADGGIDPRYVAELWKRPQQLRISGSEKLRGNLIQTQVVGGKVVAHVADVAESSNRSRATSRCTLRLYW
jgi:hypothetical protein